MQCQRSNTLRCVGIFLVAHAIFSCEHASQQTIQNSTSHDASVDTSADDAASSDTHGTLPDSSSDHADDESFDDSSATNDLSGETSADPKEILIVSAGSYQEEVQAMFVLRGEVSVQHSDAHPTLQWQQTRGPPARFIDPQSIATPRVEVPGPGRYRFRLVASTESSTAFADTLHHFGEVKQSEVKLGGVDLATPLKNLFKNPPSEVPSESCRGRKSSAFIDCTS